MSEIKYLPVEEFRSLGYLMEANRQFFHPHGLALEVRTVGDAWKNDPASWSEWEAARVHDVSEAIRLTGNAPANGVALNEMALAVLRALYPPSSIGVSGIWDYRDDPEGIYFGNLDDHDAERIRAIDEDRVRRRAKRAAFFGTDDEPGVDSLEPDPVDVEPLSWRPPEE